MGHLILILKGSVTVQSDFYLATEGGLYFSIAKDIKIATAARFYILAAMTSANRKQRAQLRELPSKWAWLVSALYVKLRQLKKNTKRNKKRQEDFFGKLFSLGFHYVAIFRNRLETESQSMFCTSFGSYNGRILNIFRVKGLILVFLNKNNGGGAISH